MTDHQILLLTALRTLGGLLALVLVVLAFRAWTRSRDGRMARLGAGFALLLASLLVEGLTYEVLLPGNLLVAHIAEAATQLAAFAVLIWALF